MSESAHRNKTAYRVLAFGFLLVFVYLYAISLKPLYDPDLWAHMKMGQLIIETKSLPGKIDPFSYTTPSPLTDSQMIGVLNQWMGQVFFYIVYVLGGAAGIVMFRSLMIVVPFVWLYWRFVNKGLDPFSSLSITFLPALVPCAFLALPYERPQAFSFVLSLVLVALIERLRECDSGSGACSRSSSMAVYISLPVVMALWSNMHGAYVVGVIIICAYAAGEALSLLWSRLREGRASGASWKFFVVLAVSAVCSGLNPNGYAVINSYVINNPLFLLRTAKQGAGGPAFLEYRNVLYFFTEFGNYWAVYAVAFLAISFIVLIMKWASARSIRPSRLFVFSFVGFIGFYYVRSLEFALFILTYYAGEFVLSMGRKAKIFVVCLYLAVSAAFLVQTSMINPVQISPGPPANWVSDRYPDAALQFLMENDIKGPMFNYMLWGGYIMWKSYPQYRVFVDGRSISMSMVMTETSIREGTRGWQQVLDAYNVNVILIPLVSPEIGVVSGLALDVAKGKAPEWKLVYLVNNQMILLRDNADNRRFIEKNHLPNELILDEGLWITEVLLRGGNANRNLLVSRAAVLYLKGRYDEASRLLDGIEHPSAEEIRKLLRQKGY